MLIGLSHIMNNLLKNFIHYNPLIMFILICIMPFALISGPFLPDLIVVIVGILAFTFCIVEKNKIYLINKFLFFFLFLYLIFLLSSFLSNNIYFSLSSSLFYFRFFLFSVGMCIALERFPIKYILFSMCISILILFADGTYQYIFGYNSLGTLVAEQNRVSSFFGKELKMGSFVIRLLPLIVAIILVTNLFKKYNLLIIFSLISISLFLILLSGERTSLAMFLIFIFFTIRLLFNDNIKYSFLLATVIAIIFLLMIFLDANLYYRLIFRTFNQSNIVNIFSDLSSVNILSHHHDALYKSAYNMFLQNPLFGIGPKMFRLECVNYISILSDCSTHPHNFYIQLLSEVGIIGFLFFLLIILYFLKNFIQIYIDQSNLYTIQFFSLMSILIQFLPFFPSGNFFNNWLNAIIFYSLGFYFYAKKNRI